MPTIGAKPQLTASKQERAAWHAHTHTAKPLWKLAAGTSMAAARVRGSTSRAREDWRSPSHHPGRFGGCGAQQHPSRSSPPLLTGQLAAKGPTLVGGGTLVRVPPVCPYPGSPKVTFPVLLVSPKVTSNKSDVTPTSAPAAVRARQPS